MSLSRHFQQFISKMAPTSTEDDATATSQDGIIVQFLDIFLFEKRKWFNFKLMCYFYVADSQSTRRSKRSVKRNAGASSALDKIRCFDQTSFRCAGF